MNNYRNTTEYREWQKQVKERDGGLCRSCQNKYYLDVHHIFRVESHPHLSDHIDNGITLCKNCHAKLKNKENDIDFLVDVVTQPLREQMDRLNQTNRSIERVRNTEALDIEPVEKKIDDLIVIPAQFDGYDHIDVEFSEGLTLFRIGDWKTGKHGFINRTGEIVIPAQFDRVGSFSGRPSHLSQYDHSNRLICL